MLVILFQLRVTHAINNSKVPEYYCTLIWGFFMFFTVFLLMSAIITQVAFIPLDKSHFRILLDTLPNVLIIELIGQVFLPTLYYSFSYTGIFPKTVTESTVNLRYLLPYLTISLFHVFDSDCWYSFEKISKFYNCHK